MNNKSTDNSEADAYYSDSDIGEDELDLDFLDEANKEEI